MKKNGFTLIELLAVILILSLLTFLAVTSVTKIVRNSKEKLYDTQILSIKKAAESWGAGNLTLLPEDGECIYLTLRNLKDNGLLDENLIDPITNEMMTDSLKVKITSKQTSMGKEYYEYEITDDVSSCNQVYNYTYFELGEPVYFDVSKGIACTEAEYKQSYGEYQTYDEEDIVTINDYGNSKAGYNGIDNKDENQNSCLKFYAFDETSDGVVSLLLDHDIALSAWNAWNSGSGYENSADGPTTILAALKTGTASWEGTEPLMNYSYQKDYDNISIDYTIDYTDFNARLITIEEVNKIRSDSFATYIGDTKLNWLYERLYHGFRERFENGSIYAESASYLYGYWTANSCTDDDYPTQSALAVKIGTVQRDSSYKGTYGVRPVIEVLRYKLIES